MKVRLVASAVWTYEADSEDYGTEDPRAMAAQDECIDDVMGAVGSADDVTFTVRPYLPAIDLSEPLSTDEIDEIKRRWIETHGSQ